MFWDWAVLLNSGVGEQILTTHMSGHTSSDYVHAFFVGMHEDARMCLSIALTAARLGANVGNHVEVVELLKCVDSETGKTEVSGARVKDTQTGNNNNNHNFYV